LSKPSKTTTAAPPKAANENESGLGQELTYPARGMLRRNESRFWLKTQRFVRRRQLTVTGIAQNNKSIKQ